MSAARILLVEDQSALARTYQGFLRGEPYKLHHVEAGEAALQAMEDMPDAVLLDVKLPDMNGLDVLKTIREKGLTTQWSSSPLTDRCKPRSKRCVRVPRIFWSSRSPLNG